MCIECRTQLEGNCITLWWFYPYRVTNRHSVCPKPYLLPSERSRFLWGHWPFEFQASDRLWIKTKAKPISNKLLRKSVDVYITTARESMRIRWLGAGLGVRLKGGLSGVVGRLRGHCVLCISGGLDAWWYSLDRVTTALVTCCHDASIHMSLAECDRLFCTAASHRCDWLLCRTGNQVLTMLLIAIYPHIQFLDKSVRDCIIETTICTTTTEPSNWELQKLARWFTTAWTIF
jgi:hypothetical protein